MGMPSGDRELKTLDLCEKKAIDTQGELFYYGLLNGHIAKLKKSVFIFNSHRDITRYSQSVCKYSSIWI